MKHTLLFILINLSINIAAQTVNENLYFITDKYFYQNNDTICIRGTLLDPENRQAIGVSHYCYIELIDNEGQVIKRKKLRCLEGLFSTQIGLNNITDRGVFFLRACTHFIKNFSVTS